MMKDTSMEIIMSISFFFKPLKLYLPYITPNFYIIPQHFTMLFMLQYLYVFSIIHLLFFSMVFYLICWFFLNGIIITANETDFILSVCNVIYVMNKDYKHDDNNNDDGKCSICKYYYYVFVYVAYTVCSILW